MDVRQAARTAKTYIADVFADEDIDEVGLEEVDFDDRSNLWKITISFLRPRGRMNKFQAAASGYPAGTPTMRRSFKIVNIDDGSGSVVSVKHRVVEGVD